MGGLPEQLDTNLKILERLQGVLNQLGDNLRDAENRKIVIQNRIEEQSRSRAEIKVSSSSQRQEVGNIVALRGELAALKAKYTGNHPDIMRLKEAIASLELEQIQSSAPPVPPARVANATPKLQLQDVELEIRSLKTEIKNTKSQTAWYQKMVERTPRREQELFSLSRDYENLKEIYKSLLNRKLEAEIALSMERKQKGEQFRVLDFAKRPSRPVKPDKKKAILLTLVLGIGWGLGLAYLVETKDDSYMIPEELERELRLPVVVSMPFLKTGKERRNQNIIATLKAASVAAGFTCSVIGIVLASKRVDTIMSYLKTILDKI
jgi:uncharacterized protein involved in exopolysaccharide biosynthesis